jgi:hypothetical protein
MSPSLCFDEHRLTNLDMRGVQFFELTKHSVNLLLDDGRPAFDLPFTLSPEEDDISREPTSLFVLGRSGTGKTSVIMTRLYRIEVAASRQRAVDLASEKKESGASAANEGKALTQANRFQHLQLLVTASRHLCSAFSSHFRQLRVGHEVLSAESASGTKDDRDSKHAKRPETASGSGSGSGSGAGAAAVPLMQSAMASFSMALDDEETYRHLNAQPNTFAAHAIDPRAFPLFLTFNKLLRMLDGSLAQPFFAPEAAVETTNSADTSASTTAATASATSSAAATASAFSKVESDSKHSDPSKPRGRRAEDEVDYDAFVGTYWPHFAQNLTKYAALCFFLCPRALIGVGWSFLTVVFDQRARSFDGVR